MIVPSGAYKSMCLPSPTSSSTICTRIQVYPHISRPSVYHLVSDAADAINSVSRDAVVRKVRIYCSEINSWSQQGATQHRAASGHVQRCHYDTVHHLRCQSCASHAHVSDLPAIMQHGTHCTPFPPARSSCCSIKLRRPTWLVCYGRGYFAECGKLPTGNLRKIQCRFFSCGMKVKCRMEVYGMSPKWTFAKYSS